MIYPPATHGAVDDIVGYFNYCLFHNTRWDKGGECRYCKGPKWRRVLKRLLAEIFMKGSG